MHIQARGGAPIDKVFTLQVTKDTGRICGSVSICLYLSYAGYIPEMRCPPDLWRTCTSRWDPPVFWRSDACRWWHTNYHVRMKGKENFKRVDGKIEGAENTAAAQTLLHSGACRTLTSLPLGRSLGGLLLLIILLLKPERIPASGPDERSAAKLCRHRAVSRSKPILSDALTPCCFDTVAHKEAEALAGWQSFITFFNWYLHPFLSKWTGVLNL